MAFLPRGDLGRAQARRGTGAMISHYQRASGPHRLAHPFAAEVERQFVPAGPHCGRGIRQRSDALAALKRPFSQWLTRGVSASITPQISVIVGAGIGCIRLFAVSAGGSLADKWGTKRGNDVRHRTAHRLSRA